MSALARRRDRRAGIFGRRTGRAMAGIVLMLSLAATPPASAPPAPVYYNDEIEAVYGLSPTDAWAVGVYSPEKVFSPSIPLIEHWNGSAWVRTPVDDAVECGYCSLSGVWASSPSDAWVVGWREDDDATEDFALMQHWDGTSWTSVTPPALPYDHYLDAIDGTSASDVWAVGSSWNALVEHYDGSSWSIVPIPDPVGSTAERLSGVVALAPDDVWVAGTYLRESDRRYAFSAHWDGVSWSIVPMPNPDVFGDSVYDLGGSSSTTLWAVGDAPTRSGGFRARIWHWTGTVWKIVSAPSPLRYCWLNGVDAASETQAWAVGYCSDNPTTAYLLRWNGTIWRQVASPILSFPALNDVDSVSANLTWAVGDYSKGANQLTLIERWTGTTWQRTPSPNV